MSRIKKENLHDFLVIKESLYNVRLTSFVHGNSKKMFFYDCIQREWNESKMVQHIIDFYYQNNSNIPSIDESQVTHFRAELERRLTALKEKEENQLTMPFEGDKKY